MRRHLGLQEIKQNFIECNLQEVALLFDIRVGECHRNLKWTISLKILDGRCNVPGLRNIYANVIFYMF